MGEPAVEIDKEEEERILKEKEEAIARDKILKEVAKNWNMVIASILKAHLAWEDYRASRLNNLVRIEEFPLEFQKILMLANPHGDFDLLIEDLITRGKHIQLYLKEQFIKL